MFKSNSVKFDKTEFPERYFYINGNTSSSNLTEFSVDKSVLLLKKNVLRRNQIKVLPKQFIFYQNQTEKMTSELLRGSKASKIK